MKTSKRLLSFFLAVVMLVSVCGAGLQAFAAQTNPDPAKFVEPKSSQQTLDRMNEAFNYYLPQILGIPDVKAALESIGIIVTEDTDVPALIAGLLPTVIRPVYTESFLAGITNKPTRIAAANFEPTFINEGVRNVKYQIDKGLDFVDLYALTIELLKSDDVALKSYAVSIMPTLFRLFKARWTMYYEKLIPEFMKSVDPNCNMTARFTYGENLDEPTEGLLELYNPTTGKYVNAFGTEPLDFPGAAEYVRLTDVGVGWGDATTPAEQAFQDRTKPFMETTPDHVTVPSVENEMDEFGLVYDYSQLAPTQDESLHLMNYVMNDFLSTLLDKENMIGSMIDGMLNDLLQTPVDVNEITHDIINKLAQDPIGTIINLIPVLSIVIDEFVVGSMFMTADEEANVVSQKKMTMNGILKAVLAIVSPDTPNELDLVMDLNLAFPEFMKRAQYMIAVSDATASWDTNAKTAAVEEFFNLVIVNDETYIAALDDAQFNLQQAQEDLDGDPNNTDKIAAVKRCQTILNSVKPNYINRYTSGLAIYEGQTLDMYKQYVDFICAKANINADTYSTPIIQLIQKMSDALDIVNQTADLNQIPDGFLKAITAMGQVIVPAWKGFGEINDNVKTIKGNYQTGKKPDTAKTLSDTVDVLLELVNPIISLVDCALSDSTSTNNVISILQSLINGFDNTYAGLAKTIVNMLNELGGIGEKSIINYAVNEIFQLDNSNKFALTLPAISHDTVMYVLANLRPIIDSFFPNSIPGTMGDLIDGVVAGFVTNFKWPTSATTALWSFMNYSGTSSSSFKYPTGITELEANNAVNQIDSLLKNIFPLLSSFVALPGTDLNDIVGGLLYTNANVTSLMKTIYSAIEGVVITDTLSLSDILKALNISTEPSFVKAYLKDASYGRTYANAATKIGSVASWKDLNESSVNWGFADGDKEGFLNALVASLRPFNSIASVLLAGDSISIQELLINLAGILNKLGKIDIANDFLTGIDFSKVDFETAVQEAQDKNLYGGNGYESAVVPVLEALLCDGFPSYDQYKTNISKSKDAVLLDILNPIFNKVTDVLNNPIDQLTQTLPNLAYFFENDGLIQALLNLLNPITSIFFDFINRNNAMDMEQLNDLINKIMDLISTAAGTDINLDLSNLGDFNIQDMIIPLINALTGFEIPLIDWAELASHGTIVQVPSAVNATGTRTIVQANRGETLIAVLRYVFSTFSSLYNGSVGPMIDALLTAMGGDAGMKDLLPMILNALKSFANMNPDDIIITLFYFLSGDATNAYWDYTDYIVKAFKFKFPRGINQRNAAQATGVLDELISGFLDLPKLVNDNLFTNGLVNTLAKAIYTNLPGLKLGDVDISTILDVVHVKIDAPSVAALLTDGSYGATYAAASTAIANAKTWDKVDFDKLDWGVKDKATFVQALAAVLRPLSGVLDVLLNGGSLGLLDALNIPGSNGYESAIVPLLEALNIKGIKSYAEYNADAKTAKDNLLINIINPVLGFLDDLVKAPITVLAQRIPNLALFISNGGIINLVNQLVTPLTAIIELINPIININDLLAALDVKVNNEALDLNNIGALLTPYVGAENIIPLVNSLLPKIEISEGVNLNLKLNTVDWSRLASHGSTNAAQSAVKNIGSRLYTASRSGETLIAVLRYLIDTIKAGDNLTTVSDLIGGLLGDIDASIKDMITMVLGMLATLDTDEIIITLFQLFGLWEEVPDTGDTSIALFAVIAVVSAAAIVTLTAISVKKKREQE